jgi:hypothetical protein
MHAMYDMPAGIIIACMRARAEHRITCMHRAFKVANCFFPGPLPPHCERRVLSARSGARALRMLPGIRSAPGFSQRIVEDATTPVKDSDFVHWNGLLLVGLMWETSAQCGKCIFLAPRHGALSDGLAPQISSDRIAALYRLSHTGLTSFAE